MRYPAGLLILSCTFFDGIQALHAAEVPPGEKIYIESCARCHDAAATGVRIPSRKTLEQMSSAEIFKALDSGIMRAQGATIGAENRRVVADYLGVKPAVDEAKVATGLCAATGTAWTPDMKAPAWNGWSPDTTNSRFADSASAGLKASDVPRLQVKWAFSMGDTKLTRAQPVVVSGRVFTSSQTGSIYSLDAKTGCTYWQKRFLAPLRGGVVITTVQGRAMAIMGDALGLVHALDAATGEPIWVQRVDDHPAKLITATPVVYQGVVYVPVASYEEVLPANPQYACCTFRGSISALDAATGHVLWKTYTIADKAVPQKPNTAGVMQMGPSGAAIWSSATIDTTHDRLYVATGDNYSAPTTDTSDAVMALDRITGKILWSKQLTANDLYNSSCDAGKESCPDSHGGDFDFGSSPALVALPDGRRALVIGQKSGMLHALDPDNEGAVLWSARLGHGGSLGGIEWGSAVEGGVVFTPLSDIAFDAASKENGLTPSPTKGGGMFAYQIGSGERLWYTPPPGCGDRRPCSPAQSAAASAIPGVVFSGADDGHLRAYSTSDGKIVWDFDTARDYQTVNGLPAKGGAMDAAGPAIVDGMVYVNSGYAQWGSLPGNVLLAFSVDGK